MMGGAGREAANREVPRFAVKNMEKKSCLVGHNFTVRGGRDVDTVHGKRKDKMIEDKKIKMEEMKHELTQNAKQRGLSQTDTSTRCIDHIQ